MKQRTLLQNRALHKFFDLLAEALNDAGLDVQKTLRHDIEIPWNGTLVKELIWRPVQEAMTNKESTTELETPDPSHIYEVISRYLGAKFGLYVPFPSEETLYQEKEYAKKNQSQVS